MRVAVVLLTVGLMAGVLGCTAPSGDTPGTSAGQAEGGSETLIRTPAPLRPVDAKPFGKHWYKAFDEDISWHDARKRCEAMGGRLACIESAEEQAFIAQLAGGRYLYLGGTDEEVEDTWTWINGSAWTFSVWMDGQPNNYGKDEHYLATYDGGEWVDVAAEGEGFWMPTGFICEWVR